MKGVKNKREWHVSHYFFLISIDNTFCRWLVYNFLSNEKLNMAFWCKKDHFLYFDIIIYFLEYYPENSLFLLIRKFKLSTNPFFIWERMKESHIFLVYTFLSQMGDKYSWGVINFSQLVMFFSTNRRNKLNIPAALAYVKVLVGTPASRHACLPMAGELDLGDI